MEKRLLVKQNSKNGLRKLILVTCLFLLIFLTSSMVSATYSRYYVQPPTFVPYTGKAEPLLFDRAMCGAGQDFLLQISPTGCTPSVVRSDLLEDQNVPVFCPITATQLNPLIDIESIYHMTFRGEYSPEVQAIHYFPARAALGRYGAEVNHPVLDNIGYALIVLKQQKNASKMPDYVSGNLTAVMRYDIKNAFGVGQANFYLPEITDENEWNENYKRYSFWDGRGYLRAEAIDEDSASISIYSDRETYGFGTSGEKRRLSSTTLRVGERSPEIPMPGFDYCLGTMQLELNRLEDPGTRARLNVNGDIVEVKDEEKFLDNKCQIKDIEKQGINEKVVIRCKEDEKTSTFPLTITPKINLSIGGILEEHSVGDRLYLDGKGEKTVYLAYITTKGNTGDEKDLVAGLVAIPGVEKEKLTNAELKAFAGFFKRAPKGDVISLIKEIDSIIDPISLTLKAISTIGEKALRYMVQGIAFKGVSFQEAKEVFGKSITLVGFVGAQDAELAGDFKDYYEKAIEDYDEVLDGFSSEKYPSDDEKTLGEKSLFNKIKLAEEANQKKTTSELCEEFRENYPNSAIPLICDEMHKLSSPENAVQDVEINGRIERISFEKIIEPDFDDFGALISVKTPDGTTKPLELSQNEEYTLNETTGAYIQLIDVDKDGEVNSAKIRTNLKEGVVEGVAKVIVGGETTVTLKEGFPDSRGGYIFSLQQVNLKKLAKVSVKPNIRYSQTNASFSFKIGVEKRAIKLSPEKTAERVESINNTISKWGKINDGLGKIVTGFKWGCLGVGAGLTVKNFFANLGGKGIARNKVMRTPDVGWFERCQVAVDKGYKIGDKGPWTKVDSCLLDNNEAINTAVSAYANIMKSQDQEIEKFQKLCKKKFLGEEISNTDCLIKLFVDDDADYKSELSSNLDGKIDTVRVGDKDVPVSDIINSINSDNVFITQAKSLQLNSRLLGSDDEYVREIAQSQVEADLGDIWVNNENEVERQSFAGSFGNAAALFSSDKDLKKIPITDVKEWRNVKSEFVGGTNIHNDNFTFKLKDRSDGKEYLLVLDNEHVIQQTYSISGNVLNLEGVDEEGKFNPNTLGIALDYFDRTTYENHYDNAEIRYYETAPYKGLPAIVPFDIKNGWYAAIKSTLPITPIAGGSGNIRAYDDSGRVSSFWLCNVGQDGREEFNSGIGDDICEMINLGTGQPYNQFPGLEGGEASQLVTRAVNAIEFASDRYRAGIRELPIEGQVIKVGEPAINIPDIQCQDFMSPSDCNILFNVCDPVVCPSSRCDLGGKYPVKDVVQSGIAGSIFLCAPNGVYWGGDVYVPVCLSGIHAASEAYLSILDSYQQCLQTSLETGETVGICDEIYSIHLCEFFWRQSLPLAQIAIPKIIGAVLGQNVRGGGEYLGVQDAWQRASDSVTYFAQYYAANSFKAFKARTAEGVGAEMCKTFVSLATPQVGSLLDALVAPDSPPQFYGRFDEIPFTTATNPPTSHYKVFYHIYAGRDLPAYFQVYLQGAGSSFFQDTSFRRVVAHGFIKAGEYATETKDFTAPSGYQEMCIIVNGQEECGFKQVTTDFGLNWVTDKYVQQQASQTDIKTESACVSGTPSAYSLINPNLQEGVGEAINPAIYNRGITRICATDDPGKATDSAAGTESARWVDVGYCGNEKIRCWLDTHSVKDTIKITSIEEKVLDDVGSNYLDALKKEHGYVEDFGVLVEEIEKESDMEKKLEKIEENYGRVFYPHEKGYLTLLRADAYKELALAVKPEEEATEPEEPEYEVSEEEEKVLEITEELEAALESGTTSPIFKLEYGGFLGAFKKSIYYLYSGGYWFFSFKGEERAKAWFPIDENIQNMQTIDPHGRLINPYEALSEEDQEFTIEFADKSYEEGLRLLISRTVSDKGKLSTDSVKFSHKGRFEIDRERAATLELEYDYEQEKWKWSIGQKIWMFVPETVVNGGPFSGIKPAQVNIDLIENLEDKNYFDGAKIIFDIDSLTFQGGGGGGTGGTAGGGETCPNPNPSEEVLELTKARDRVLAAVEELEGKPACLPTDACCGDSIKFVYVNRADVTHKCYYSDEEGKTYVLDGETITIGVDENDQGEIIFQIPTKASSCIKPIGALNYQQKIDQIQAGDWLDIAWPKKDGGVSSHAVIFIKWIDEQNKIAQVFDWIGGGYRTYGYQEISLAENIYPVYFYKNPIMA